MGRTYHRTLYEAIEEALSPLDDFFDLVVLVEGDHARIRDGGKALLENARLDIKKVMEVVLEQIGRIEIESKNMAKKPSKACLKPKKAA